MTWGWPVRQERNDKSRNAASHHCEPWSADEEELLAMWDHSEEELALIAELLGRTIEACRQRFYVATKTKTRTQTKTTITTTTVVTKWTVEFCSRCGRMDECLGGVCEDCDG